MALSEASHPYAIPNVTTCAKHDAASAQTLYTFVRQDSRLKIHSPQRALKSRNIGWHKAKITVILLIQYNKK